MRKSRYKYTIEETRDGNKCVLHISESPNVDGPSVWEPYLTSGEISTRFAVDMVGLLTKCDEE